MWELTEGQRNEFCMPLEAEVPHIYAEEESHSYVLKHSGRNDHDRCDAQHGLHKSIVFVHINNPLKIQLLDPVCFVVQLSSVTALFVHQVSPLLTVNTMLKAIANKGLRVGQQELSPLRRHDSN